MYIGIIIDKTATVTVHTHIKYNTFWHVVMSTGVGMQCYVTSHSKLRYDSEST